MQKKLNKSIFIILAVFLLTGMSVIGWTLHFQYTNLLKNAKFQKEPKNESQAAIRLPTAANQSNTILLLTFTGLIGLIGIRRQGRKLENINNLRLHESGWESD